MNETADSSPIIPKLKATNPPDHSSPPSINMFSPAALTKMVSLAMLLALANNGAQASQGSLTRRSRYNLSARQNGGGRQSGCGSLKNNLPNVGTLAGQCVCFDTIALTNPGNGGPSYPTPVFAQTQAALDYSIALPVRYPTDVS